MFKDPRNPLDNRVIERRIALKERIENLLKNPESILEQQDILYVERRDENFLAIYFYSPAKDRKYHTVPLDCNFTESGRHLVFCYERNWEAEGYNESTPVIETGDGKQIECGILDLDDFEETERAILEEGLNQVQRIIEIENATMLE